MKPRTEDLSCVIVFVVAITLCVLLWYGIYKIAMAVVRLVSWL